MLKDIFPTKIGVVQNFLTKKEIKDLYNYIIKLPHKEHPAIIGNGKSTHLNYSNSLKEKNLEQKINKEIKKYCNSCGLFLCELDICWSNIQKKDSFLKMHSHCEAPVVGIIYIKTDEKSSKLYFQNPNPHSMVTTYNMDCNQNILCCKVNAGDLFIFPGWLQHGSYYELNKSRERVVLSFNCKNI